MNQQVEDMKKQIDDMSKHYKDYEVSFTVIETQLKSKKALLERLEGACAEFKSFRDNLERDFNDEKKAKIEALEQRLRDCQKRESALSGAESEYRRSVNFLEEDRGKLKAKIAEVDAEKAAWKNKIERIGEFIKQSQVLLENLK